MPASAGAASLSPQTGVKCVDLEIVGQEMWGSDEQRQPAMEQRVACVRTETAPRGPV